MVCRKAQEEPLALGARINMLTRLPQVLDREEMWSESPLKQGKDLWIQPQAHRPEPVSSRECGEGRNILEIEQRDMV